MRILVAEDDAVSRLVVVRILGNLGHDVVAAGSGREAWAAFEREHFPVLLSDWMMPDVDGLELCRRVRAAGRERYTYVLLVTALGGKSRYLEAMDAGVDDFVTKPVDGDELRARLRVAERVLGLQREVQQLAGLLPTCAYCRSIRTELNEWIGLERYVAERTQATFSHGICPSCYASRVRPELDALRRQRQGEAGAGA